MIHDSIPWLPYVGGKAQQTTWTWERTVKVRYFFWFETRNGISARRQQLFRKPLDAPKNKLSSICDPGTKKHAPLVEAVIAYAVKERLLPKALEAERAKAAEEQARWRERRRVEAINKFGVELYEQILFGQGAANERKLLTRIDEALTKLDAEPIK